MKKKNSHAPNDHDARASRVNHHETHARTPRHKRIPSDSVVGFVGGYLIEQGAITLEQLDRALLKQMELANHGETLSLGEVLIRMGLVNSTQLARAEKQMQADLKKQQRR